MDVRRLVLLAAKGVEPLSHGYAVPAPLGKGSLEEGVFDKAINIFTDAGEVFIHF